MSCTECHFPIDYRYQTTCPNCDHLIKIEGDLAAQELNEERNLLQKIGHALGGMILVLSTSFIGVILGAIVLYLIAMAMYVVVADDQVSASYECARGNAIAWLSILAGAFFGGTGGSVFGFYISVHKQDTSGKRMQPLQPQTEVK